MPYLVILTLPAFHQEKKMIVFVEHSVLDDPLLAGAPAWAGLESKVQTFTDGKDDLTDKIDFIVCLGGDGTLLYASSLFQVGPGTGRVGAVTG